VGSTARTVSTLWKARVDDEKIKEDAVQMSRNLTLEVSDFPNTWKQGRRGVELAYADLSCTTSHEVQLDAFKMF